MDIEDSRKQKILNFFRDNDNLIFAAIIALVVIIRLYYFFRLGEQPIWWDEGDYLAIAKVWSTSMQTPEWWSHFTGMRPLLLPIIWAAMFKIGFSEYLIRFFTILLPSIGSVVVCYLLGKELFDKKVGAISSIMLAFYWVFTFYTYRLLTDIPAVFFGLLAFYFFVGDYANRGKARGLYLAALFGVIAFSIRFPYALVLVTCAVFLLFTRKHHVFKDKTIWKGAGLTLLFLSPYLIYFIINKFAAIRFYFGDQAVTVHQPIAWYVFSLFFSLPESFWMTAIAIGLLSLYPIFMYADVVWNQKSKKFNSELLLFLWLFIHFLFYVVIIRGATDRWILMLMPAAFILAGNGIMKIANWLGKYNSIIPILIVVVIVGGGVYQNFNHSHNLIVEKESSYLQVKLAGEWLKENTPENAKIITASIVQNQYYSERQSYDYSYNNTQMYNAGCIDPYGSTSTNSSCQELSERLFEMKRQELKPDYFIASIFEPVFTPQWVYTYAQRKNLTFVQGYFLEGTQQPALIIYKF